MKTPWRTWLLLSAALLVVVPLSAVVGTVSIPLREVWQTVLAAVGRGHPDPVAQTILMDVRLPRVFLVAVVGGALALCGGVLQATFRNPLADPGLLGISAGGSLGAVVAIHLGLAGQWPMAIPVFAFAGATLSVMAVFLVSNLGGPSGTTSLLLTGVAVGFLATSLMSYLLLGADEPQLRQTFFWLVGGAEARTWKHLWLILGPIAVGSALLLLWHRPMDALMLGDEQALSVGVEAQRFRYLFLGLSALVAGAAVSVCGAIGFVGLVVPHILRLFTGPSARRLLPACVLGGAVFLVLCDLVARVISGHTEVPMGIITSLMGVPFFLWLLTRTRREAWT